MLRIILLMIVLLGVVYITLFAIHQDTNYVVVGFEAWVVKTSFTTFISFLAILFLLIYLIVRCLLTLWISPRILKGWRRGRRNQSAQSALEDGLLAWQEDDWKASEAQLVLAARKGANPAISYGFAASAANNMGDSKSRDKYLSQAANNQKTYNVALGLLQAKMLYESGQCEELLVTLRRCHAEVPGHIPTLKMLHRFYTNEEDWESLIGLVVALRTYAVYPEPEIVAIELRCHNGNLDAKKLMGKEAFDKYWEAIPESQRMSEELLKTYVEANLGWGSSSNCEALLRTSINCRWCESLVALYGVIDGNSRDRLKMAEKWLENYQTSAALYLTLARLCMREKLKGRARLYLRKSLEIAPNPEVSLLMIELLLKNQEFDEIGVYAINGLKSVPLDKNPEVTMPKNKEDPDGYGVY